MPAGGVPANNEMVDGMFIAHSHSCEHTVKDGDFRAWVCRLCGTRGGTRLELARLFAESKGFSSAECTTCGGDMSTCPCYGSAMAKRLTSLATHYDSNFDFDHNVPVDRASLTALDAEVIPTARASVNDWFGEADRIMLHGLGVSLDAPQERG